MLKALIISDLCVAPKERRRVSRVSKASSDAGPELAGRAAIVAMESPKALMCPLEKGVRGIETGHQMPGRSWRAGQPCGDGKPEGPDVPP